MENTIKKQIKTTNNADGSYTIEYKGARFKSLFMPLIGLLILFIFIIYTISKFPVFGWPIALVLMVSYVIYFGRKKQLIKVRPRVGIEFYDSAVPFSDISAVGVSIDGNAGTAYIIVNGNRVVIANGKNTIVNEINHEVKKLSGIGWN